MPSSRFFEQPMQQLLTVDLKELKPRLLEAAAAAGDRPSAWARNALAKALGLPAPMPAAAAAPNHRDAGAAKVTLRIPREDHAALGELAQREGLSRSDWLRHRIRQPAAPAVQPELVQALAQSSYQLAGIGRNLNQVARSLNARPGTSTRGDRAAIDAAIAAIRAHLAQAEQVVAAFPQTTRRRRAGRSR
jgi:hypothetical protein